MPKKKPDFPNNYKELAAVPSEAFVEVPYQDFMDWKIGGWLLPSSIAAIVRVKNNNGKIKEFIYRSYSGAGRKVTKLMEQDDTHEITIVDEHEVKLIQMEPFDEN